MRQLIVFVLVGLSLFSCAALYVETFTPPLTEIIVDDKSFTYYVVDSTWVCINWLNYELLLQRYSSNYASQHYLDSVATIKYGYIDTSLTWNQDLVPNSYYPYVWYLLASTNSKCIDSTVKYTNYKCEAMVRFHFEKGKDIRYEFPSDEEGSANRIQNTTPGEQIEKRIVWNQSYAPTNHSLLLNYICRRHDQRTASISFSDPTRISP